MSGTYSSCNGISSKKNTLHYIMNWINSGTHTEMYCCEICFQLMIKAIEKCTNQHCWHAPCFRAVYQHPIEFIKVLRMGDNTFFGLLECLKSRYEP